MNMWDITIENWPHSTGVGGEEDQQAAGPSSTTYQVTAENIAGALYVAQQIALGILTNPRVWQAPIVSIVKVR